LVSTAPLNRIASLSTELQELAERTRRGVVQVSDGRGAGAGTIWSSDGLIVTNHHVVPGERARVTTSDGLHYDAQVIRNLPDRDLAILRVDATDLQPLPPGNPNALRPGELVMAVGHPFGITGATSLGIFSGIGPIEHRRGRHFREAVMANIELRPGNSGGPLVTVNGDVIGINAMVLGPGTALAVPSTVVTRLLDAGHPRRLGISVGMVATPRELEQSLSVDRDTLIMVLDVHPDGPAARQLLPGDMLLSIDSHPIEEPGDIALALSSAGSTEQIELTIIRAGQRQTLSVSISAS
jgi:serine protease Do